MDRENLCKRNSKGTKILGKNGLGPNSSARGPIRGWAGQESSSGGM